MADPDIEAAETPPTEASTSKDSPDKKEEKEPLATVGEVFSFGPKKKKWYLAGGLFCAVVVGCVFPAMIFYFAKAFEDLGASTDSSSFLDNIRTLAFTFMILGVIAGLFMTAQATLLETAAGMMTDDLKISWFNALLRQDMAYFDIKDVAGDATIISSNCRKYKKGMGRKLGEGIQFTITFCGGLGYAFYASWKSSLVILTCLPFMTIAVLFLLKMTQSQSTRAQETYAEAGAIVQTTASAIRTILSLNAVETMIKKFVEATKRAYDGAVRQVHIVGLANGSVMGSFLLAYVAVALYGSFLLYDNVKKTGCDPSGAVEGVQSCNPSGMDVFGSLMGVTIAASVLPQVTVAIEALVGARAACYPALVAINRKVDKNSDADKAVDVDVDNAKPSLPNYVIDSSSSDGLKPSKVNGEIEFKDVTFAYPTRLETEVFKKFSLRFEAGKTVALVGPSGSGKSTTVQLIERFYDPTCGTITLDGIDLKELNVKWLRSQIGLVSQEPVLFNTTIADNIRYGLPGATQDQIEEAAKLANAHDFIKSFPKGYDTQVGDKGAQLSGGQKQRVAIARVLISNPQILLLDEATSALDSESESIVQDALDQLLEVGNRTTIVIAHRLSTIRNADLIAVVKDGKISEAGSHEELIQAKGDYFDLVETQRLQQAANPDSNAASRNASVVDLPALGEKMEKTPLLNFDDVCFTYPSRPDNKIFRGLNLTVDQGETVAIVGPSGGGKSTVVQLVERFYDPSSGRIELDGVDLKDLNVKWLRSNLGLVGQEPTLFNTTIAENISYGYPEASFDDIVEAAKQANAHDFIESFPEMYETLVGESGTKVSGGQKQRIALARALVRKPRILCLDEATSALDSASERIVQEALDKVMASKNQATIVIAHRLSTIRNADRIAVISNGKVREVGTHDELMAKPEGHYRRLQAYQDLDQAQESMAKLQSLTSSMVESAKKSRRSESAEEGQEEEKIDKQKEKELARRARLLARGDGYYFLVGTIGAVMAGIMFPAWGVIFAFMIELLYTPVAPCEDGVIPPPPPYQDDTCDAYYNAIADDMRDRSIKIAMGCLGLAAVTMIGNMLLYYGFGTASEKMNKRVRDAAFTSLARQEVAYFDLRSVGAITSQLQEDTAMIHSFSGQPIRTLVMNLSSVLVGLVLAFVAMWPFALLTLAILPFMAFGAEAEMRMYLGEDEGVEEEDENSPGGIVVESLLNIRTVAALTIEDLRSEKYVEALRKEDPTPLKSNLVKGASSGLGQFIQLWSSAFLFWWGGWLLLHYPSEFSYRDFLISMFALLFSLSGMGVAAQGATDREKAKAAAARVFELTDRESAIDPLSEEGKKGL